MWGQYLWWLLLWQIKDLPQGPEQLTQEVAGADAAPEVVDGPVGILAFNAGMVTKSFFFNLLVFGEKS